MWQRWSASTAPLEHEDGPSTTLNIGTGRGTTVRELVDAVEGVLGRKIPVREAAARPGDVAGGFAEVGKIQRVLGWSAAQTVDEGIASALAWERRRDAVLDSIGRPSWPAGGRACRDPAR